MVIVFSIHQFKVSHKIYGNDKGSIVKVIRSIKGFEDQPVELLGTKDFNDVRIVGFLYNGSPAEIEFNKNKKGDYEWTEISVNRNETFSSFLPSLPNNTSPKFMLVSNHENKIANMQVNVNGQLVEKTITPNKASVFWVDLPEKNNHDYTFRNYKFYDADGKLMKDISD